MRYPTENWVTCDEQCHGYPALDFSWHPSKVNFIPRKGVVAIHDALITKVNMNAGECGIQVQYIFNWQGKAIRAVNCHFESVSVSEGQKVKEGQQIGIMGKTGKSNGVHLHFYLFEDDNRVIKVKDWLDQAVKEEEDMGIMDRTEVTQWYHIALNRDPTASELKARVGSNSAKLASDLVKNKTVQQRRTNASNYSRLEKQLKECQESNQTVTLKERLARILHIASGKE